MRAVPNAGACNVMLESFLVRPFSASPSPVLLGHVRERGEDLRPVPKQRSLRSKSAVGFDVGVCRGAPCCIAGRGPIAPSFYHPRESQDCMFRETFYQIFRSEAARLGSSLISRSGSLRKFCVERCVRARY